MPSINELQSRILDACVTRALLKMAIPFNGVVPGWFAVVGIAAVCFLFYAAVRLCGRGGLGEGGHGIEYPKTAVCHCMQYDSI